MKDQIMRSLIALIFSTGMALADGDRAGEFDYYVLSLSWSPNWCAIEGDARRSPQCRDDEDFGWVLHGLWPQYHRGYPDYCRTPFRMPSRGMTSRMVDIMGDAGSAWHQWKKHGTCTGLSPEDYYALSREAYERVNRPEIFRKLGKPVQLPARVIEEAFLKDNPEWDRDMLTITCRQGRIAEARLCLSRDLDPVPCGRSVIKDCEATDALFDPIE